MGAGREVESGLALEREDGVAMRVEEDATVDKPWGTQAVQRTRTERKTSDFISVLMRLEYLFESNGIQVNPLS